MIQASFSVSHGRTIGFSVAGHALFDEEGRDIVCAAVSSALQLTANGITEVLQLPANMEVSENRIAFTLGEECEEQSGREAAVSFLDAFLLHLRLLSEDYPGTIELTISEV